MYLYELKHEKECGLRENVCLSVEPALDYHTLSKAVQIILERHEMLTVNVNRDEDSLTTGKNCKNVLVKVEKEESIQHVLNEICTQPFDYFEGPLFQVYDIKAEKKQYILLTASHLVVDGWSLSVLYQELVEVYNLLTKGETVSLPKTLSYETLQNEIQRKRQECEPDNVKKILANNYGTSSYVEFPKDVENESDLAVEHILHIKKDISVFEPIRKVAAQYKCSSFVLLLSAFQIMVREISNEDHVSVGVPLTVQTHFPQYSIVGNYDTVRPFNAIVSDQTTLSELVERNKKVFAEYNAIVDYHLRDFKELGEIEEIPTDILFNVDRMPRIPSFCNSSVGMEDVDVSGIKYDLFFNLLETDSYVKLDIDYNSERYSKELVNHWAELFFTILDEIQVRGNQCIEEYVFTTEADFIDCRSNCKTYKENMEILKKAGIINEEEGESYYCIKKVNHNPQVLGSYGYVFVGTSDYDNHNTGWFGKVNLNGTITLNGTWESSIYCHGRRISLWSVRERILKNESITYCELEHVKEKECIAAYVDFVAEYEPDKFIEYCKEQLEPFEVPELFYYDKEHNRSKDCEIRIQENYDTDTERIVHEVIQECIGNLMFTKEENLLQLGINSVKIFQIIHAIEKRFHGIKLNLSELYLNATVCKIAQIITKKLNCVDKGTVLEKGPNISEFVASKVQKRMYVLNQMNTDSVSYNLPSLIKLEGELSKESFESALQACVDRHEMIRSCFTEENGEVICKIQEHAKIDINYKEVMFGNKMDEIIEEEMKYFVRPFNLNQGPLMHVCVLESFEEQKYVVMFDFHHIVFDGMSSIVFAQDFAKAYRKEVMLPLEYHYSDYIDMQNRFMQTSLYQAEEEYWKETLGQSRVREDFLIDFPRRSDKNYTSSVYDMSIEASQAEGIKSLCMEQQCSKFAFFVAVLNLVFQRYQTSDENTFGTVIHGRTQSELYDMIGMFVNTIPLYQKIEGDDTFEQFLAKVHKNCIEGYENSDVPYDRIVELVNETVEEQGNTLFDILLSYDDFKPDTQDMLQGLNYEMEEVISPASKFDMEVLIFEKEDRFAIKIVYAKELYYEETVQQLSHTILSMINEVLENSKLQVKDYKGIEKEEEKVLIEEFNATECDYAKDKAIIELFEEQVKTKGESNAICFGNEKISYRQLNERANRLGHLLREKGIGPDDFVGLAADRSIEMMVGIYGVLKAGGAYVPIDMGYPQERVRFILQDCKPKAFLFYQCDGKSKEEHAFKKLANELEIPVIDLSVDISELEPSENLNIVTKADDLMYCIYTSGTTGKPKGVMIPNRAVVNYCTPSGCSILKEAMEDQCTKIISVTNMVFDIFVTEAILSLVNGMEIYLLDENQSKDGREAAKIMNECQIELLQTTPTRLKIWLSEARESNPFKPLKYIFIGGEKVESSLITEIRKFTDAKLVNVYGPSETTVWSTRALIEEDVTGSISIGKPISNTQVYIMDGKRLCGIGMPGELCIGGAGLARGYLNLAELTAQRFIDNPFGDGKIYRTGDLAKWRADGRIEYIGRIDEQVKIRGFRIELAGIENVIRQIDDVQDVAVIVRDDTTGEKELYAYIVGEKSDLDFIRKELARRLPVYMVPSYMAVIKELPMTKNGKLDKRALPMIESKCEFQYIEPRNEQEELLARIFAKVLGRERVGITEEFFETGGHSMKAILAVNLIEEETGVKLKLSDFFAHGTVEQLAKWLENQQGKEFETIPKAEELEEYLVSPAQERIYMAHELDEEETAYNMPAVLKFNGILNREKVEQSFRQLLNIHEVLRTSFHNVSNKIVQRIEKEVEWNLEYEYIETMEESEIEQIVVSFIRPFQLDSAPLFRVKYLESREESIILFDMHHIISDGVSIQLIKKDFVEIYNDTYDTNKSAIRYRDYSEWVRKRDITQQKEYWLKEFSGDIPVLEMPLDYKRNKIRSYNGQSVSKELFHEQVEKMDNFIKKQKVTEYMLFVSGLMITLAKYSRQEDLVIGTPVSGRVHRDTEDIIGMFGNTLALRGKPEKEKSVAEFLQEVKETCIKGLENQEYPFEELVQEVCKTRDASRSPLFDFMFVYEYENEQEFHVGSYEIEEMKVDNKTAKFDITFTIQKNKAGYKVIAEYCKDLYRQETVGLLVEHYVEILIQIVEEPNQKINELTGIGEEERRVVLEEFNDTDASYPEDKTVIELFEEQVQSKPKNIAVQYEDEYLTYEELNQKAERVGKRLSKLGVRRNDFVAFVAERSIEMAIGLYGILKSGGAYLPMDPEYPDNRFAYIISDSNTKVLLVYVRKPELLSRLEKIAKDAGIAFLNLAEEIEEEENIVIESNQPSDYIYCIYTSGTTGNPKGVKLMHYNVVRLFFNDKCLYDFDERDVWTMFHNFNFDFSVWEFFGATLFGGKLVILPYETVRDSRAVLDVLEKEKVTVFNQVPTSFYQLMREEKDRALALRYVIFGGEALKPDNLKEWYQRHQEIRVINMYGITETTVHVTYKEITMKEIEDGRSNIGKAIPTLKVYLMDDDRLCGIGMPGEICVAGAGVADGYMNLPELTEKKFIENPFGTGRLYRSGDLARWLPNGELEYLGRIDGQVKVRGFRIELSEIEKACTKVPEIRDAVALVKEDGAGDKYIQAYYVADEKLDIQYVKRTIQEYLPDYMIPSRFLQIEEVPMTANGKLNQRVLLALETEVGNEYIAPVSENEKLLENIFKEVLGLPQVSIADRFIELGGDSIKAIRIVSKVREAGYELKVKDLLLYQTIESLCEVMKESSSVKEYSQEEVTGEIPLLPIQKMFFDWKLNKPSHYNQAVMVRVKGLVNEEYLKKALQTVRDHHDMLRAVYHDGKQIVLSIQEAQEVPLYIKDYDSKEVLFEMLEQENTKVQESFELTQGPLFKAMLHKAEGESYLFLCSHHLIVDGVSWRIILEDISTAYAMLERGEVIQLPKKTASYKEWADELIAQVDSPRLREESFYWKKVIDEMSEMEYSVSNSSEYQMETIEFDEEFTRHLQMDVGKVYNIQVNEILLCATGMTYSDISEQSSIALDIEGHGREGENYQVALERTVGWFTTIYPLVLERKKDLEEQIIHVKETLSKVPRKGIGYGILATSDQFDLSLVTPELCYNYLGELDEETSEEQLFELTKLPIGQSNALENKEEHSVIINASIANGRLMLEITFDISIWNSSKRERFVEEFKKNLQMIANHCMAAEETVVTLSDLGMVDLDSSDENVLASFLDEL